MHVIGFDIGGTKCAVLLCKLEQDDIIWHRRVEIPTTSDWSAVLDSLCEYAESMLKEAKVARNDCQIGISCGGPLSADRKRICSPPNLIGWDDVPIVEYLSNRFGMATRMQNDADACALAEWKYGAGKGTSHMIFLTFGTGLGAGLILNGRLYLGASGGAGELGHIRMTTDGPVGYGKAGSLEGYCSGGGIRQLGIANARILEKRGLRASYQNGDIETITAKDIAEAALAGNQDAKEVFAQSGTYFGKGLAVLIDLLNPEVIVAGSIYARSQNLLERTMWEEVIAEALAGNVAACKIVPARLGEQIGDYGAVMAAIYE